ncbi:unnamed protein product [Paramecium sonneborni]|uniref:Uncharacterized protein n=1 Tax=Paramecium sonneborni TaxID=65129 RepID=A0A8S1QEN4_9CILI|nr:unnamed protein product [Paramecium sonneborni]
MKNSIKPFLNILLFLKIFVNETIIVQNLKNFEEKLSIEINRNMFTEILSFGEVKNHDKIEQREEKLLNALQDIKILQ